MNRILLFFSWWILVSAHAVGVTPEPAKGKIIYKRYCDYNAIGEDFGKCYEQAGRDLEESRAYLTRECKDLRGEFRLYGVSGTSGTGFEKDGKIWWKCRLSATCECRERY